MRTPAAEVDIDAGLIERLVAAQFPELAGTVRIIANGWDNVVARLGSEHSVRMPRRAVAVELIRNDSRWLPMLAPMLPVPVPAPIAVGEPELGYPWPWTVSHWLPGLPVAALPVPARRPLARELARVHRALHVPAPAGAPHNPVRGVPLAHRIPAVEERLASGAVPRADLLRGVLAEARAATPHDGPPLWLHGDPHPGNLLATGPADARLAAVIDFGDVCAGDPATDLAIAWTAFDADGRADYRDELAPDDAEWERARGWAAIIASALAASSDDHPEHAAFAAHTTAQLAL